MNEDTYRDMLKRATALIALDPEPGTPEADELDQLVAACGQYEDEHYRMEPPTEAEAAAFRREQEGRP